MFKCLNRQGVEKVGEFYLQRIDRFHYEYGEEGRVLKIATEYSSQGEDIFVTDAVGLFGQSDLGRISKNIEQALTFMGISFRII